MKTANIKTAISELIDKTSGKSRAGLARYLKVSPVDVTRTLNEDNRRVPADWIKPAAEYIGVSADMLLSYEAS